MIDHALILRNLREASSRVRELEVQLEAHGLDAEHTDLLRDRDDLTDEQEDLVYMLLKAKRTVQELEDALSEEDETPTYERHLQACAR